MSTLTFLQTLELQFMPWEGGWTRYSKTDPTVVKAEMCAGCIIAGLSCWALFYSYLMQAAMGFYLACAIVYKALSQIREPDQLENALKKLTGVDDLQKLEKLEKFQFHAVDKSLEPIDLGEKNSAVLIVNEKVVAIALKCIVPETAPLYQPGTILNQVFWLDSKTYTPRDLLIHSHMSGEQVMPNNYYFVKSSLSSQEAKMFERAFALKNPDKPLQQNSGTVLQTETS